MYRLCCTLLLLGLGSLALAAPDTAPDWAVSRSAGTVTLTAGGRTVLADALPVLKVDGQAVPAGRLVSVSQQPRDLPGLGKGREQVARYALPCGEATLSLLRFPGKPYVAARLAFVPSRAVALSEIRVLDTAPVGRFGYAPASRVRILENGHDNWLEQDVRLLMKPAASNSNWDHAVYDTASKTALVAGFLTHEHALTQMQAKPQGDTLQWAAVNQYDPPKMLAAGQTVASEWLYVDAGTGDPFAALEGFAGRVAAVLGIKPWPRGDIQAHWDSWNTRYHTDITLDNMMENARYVAKYLKPYGMRWFSIDDGYQRMVGDWYGDDDWPGGMKAFADQVHALGLKVAIWIAPFVVHVDSPVAKQHPDWFLPVQGFDVRDEWRVLDTSRPDVLKYVEDIAHRYTYEWGFDCFNETDYVYYALFGKQYAGQMTRSEAFLAGLQAIARGSKPGTFLHGFCPAGLGSGLFHGTRTGDDTGPHWQSGEQWCWGPKNQAQVAARRYYLNHRVYVLDPDAFYFAHPATLKRWGVTEPLSMDTSKAWATLVAMTGGMVKVGAAFVDLSPEELAVVRKVLPPSGVSARPLDLFDRQYPRIWQLPAAAGGPWQVLAVFDWDEPGESGPLTLGPEVGLRPEGRYIAYDFWRDRAWLFTGALQVTPPSRACSLLAVHPDLGRPQYLSTDRHVTQGALSLQEERWQAGSHRLTGAMTADPGTQQTIIFYLPPGWQPPTAKVAGANLVGTATAPCPGGGSLLKMRLAVYGQRLSWRLDFRRPFDRAGRRPGNAGGQPVERIILDTDIGTDIDDAYALAFILSRPEFELLGVTTTYGPTERRANLARALLHVAGRSEIPVFAGLPGPGDPEEKSGQLDWGDAHAPKARAPHPGPLPGGEGEARAPHPGPLPGGEGEGNAAIQWLVKTIMESPGGITLISIGPLTNIAAAVRAEPRIAGKVRAYALMGGAIRRGYNGQPPAHPEYNIKCDTPASQAAFAAPWQMLVTPLDVTMKMVLDEGMRARIAASDRPLCRALAELYPTWGHRDPILHDPLAVALVLRPDLVSLERMRLVVEDDGLTRPVPGEPNALVATEAEPQPFMEYYLDTIIGVAR